MFRVPTAISQPPLHHPRQLVDRQLDADLVYEVTAGLFAERTAMARRVAAVRALDLAEAIDTAPIDLHEGALEYYRATRR